MPLPPRTSYLVSRGYVFAAEMFVPGMLINFKLMVKEEVVEGICLYIYVAVSEASSGVFMVLVSSDHADMA
jgi:hypothetical protein